MKQTTSLLLLLSFFFFLVPHLIFSQLNKSLPVLDKTKSYPSKKLEFKTEIKYVPLETSNDVLLGEQCKLNYVSAEKFLLIDKMLGDVFIFNNEGKIYSNFNQKGGLGYSQITFVAYDEKRKELFILDQIKKKIFVFSENGVLLRSYKTPPKTFIAAIFNFNDNTLLAFDENIAGSDVPVKPYLFIAKSDGEVTGYVNIIAKKVNPMFMEEDLGKNNSMGYTFMHSGIPDNCKFGNDFILFNRSMDTTYLLNQDKILIPLFTQTPSVYSEHPTATSVGMVTDRFLKICVSSYDIKEAVKIMKAGKNWKPKFRHFILDIESGKFFEDPDKGELTINNVDTPKNQDYRVMQAVNLVKANQEGYLKGELKKVATKLDIGDNPVIRVRIIQ